MDAHHMGSRWGTVSASVMRRPGLSVAAKTVYAALATYADRAGWIWVRQETIASDLERSRAWVHAAIAELEGQGIVLQPTIYRGTATGQPLPPPGRIAAGGPRCRQPGVREE